MNQPSLVKDATIWYAIFNPRIFRLFVCLLWLWNPRDSVKKKKWYCGVGRSHLPSDNHASLLAVNHYSSLRAAPTTEQQANLLLGSASGCQARIPSKFGRVRCQSLPYLANADLQRTQRSAAFSSIQQRSAVFSNVQQRSAAFSSIQQRSAASAWLHRAAEAEQWGRTIMCPVSHYIQ